MASLKYIRKQKKICDNGETIATIAHFLFDIKQIRHNHTQLKFGTITYSSRFIRNLNWRRQNCTISGETDIKMSFETGVGTA